MILLGISARARAGKSTVAKAIAKEAASKGMSVEIFEISDYVLREAIGLKAIPPKERADLTPDDIKELMTLGATRREENPEYWIKLLMADIAKKKPDVGILPSIRFVNEAEAIRKMDGKIIRVKSFVVPEVEFISVDRDPNSAFETQLYSIEADYFLTAMRGESELLKRQAATLFNYLIDKNAN